MLLSTLQALDRSGQVNQRFCLSVGRRPLGRSILRGYSLWGVDRRHDLAREHRVRVGLLWPIVEPTILVVANDKRYRVFFHEGEDFPAVVKVASGRAWFDATGLHIESKARKIDVPLADIESAELHLRGGSMSVIRLRYRGGCIHFAVTRFIICGLFAMVDFLGTRKLLREILAATPTS